MLAEFCWVIYWKKGHRPCKYNIKVGLIELGDEESRRMELAQGRLEWQALKLAMLELLCFMLQQCQFFWAGGLFHEGSPFGTLLDIAFYFVLKIDFVFAVKTGTRTTRTSRYSTTTLMATERKTLGIAGYSIKLMLTGRGSDVERREELDEQRER